MSINSADFRSQNNVLFSANIYKMKGLSAEIGDQSVKLFEDSVVIDLNHDGKPALRTNESFNRVQLQVTEPVFVTSFPSIQELAKKQGTDIIAQDDVRTVKVESFGYDLGKWVWSGESKLLHDNRRSLENVIDEAGVVARGAKWAIDVKEGQFLVYTPKSSTP